MLASNQSHALTPITPEENEEGRRALREAFGRFATGVTIITAKTASGEEIGITANSFSSVSLEPALLLWSIATTSQHLNSFTEGFRFAVNVLAHDQEKLARHFARSGRDQFKEIDEPFYHGLGGVPLIDGAIACFECVTDKVVPAGDHNILIGRIERFGAHSGNALGFYNGQFIIPGAS